MKMMSSREMRKYSTCFARLYLITCKLWQSINPSFVFPIRKHLHAPNGNDEFYDHHRISSATFQMHSLLKRNNQNNALRNHYEKPKMKNQNNIIPFEHTMLKNVFSRGLSCLFPTMFCKSISPLYN